LSQDDFVKCTTEEEREKIKTSLDEADNWMSDADDSVETKAFVDRLADLKTLCKDVFFRLNEKKYRPRKLDELKEVFNKSTEFLNNVRNLTGEDLPLTEVEWNTLDKLINSTKDWRIKMLNEQAKVSDNEQPKLLVSDIHNKMEELKREVNYLLNKIKYFRPKTTKKPETTKPPAGAKNNTSSGDENKKQEGANGSSDGEKPSSEEQEKVDPRFANIFDEEEATTTTEKPSTTENPEL